MRWISSEPLTLFLLRHFQRNPPLCPLAPPWTPLLGSPTPTLDHVLIQSVGVHVTCGKAGGYTPAPSITLKGDQGDRVGDALLKALQLKPLVPSSQLYLLPNKGDRRQSVCHPRCPRCQQHSLGLMTGVL